MIAPGFGRTQPVRNRVGRRYLDAMAGSQREIRVVRLLGFSPENANVWFDAFRGD